MNLAVGFWNEAKVAFPGIKDHDIAWAITAVAAAHELEANGDLRRLIKRLQKFESHRIDKALKAGAVPDSYGEEFNALKKRNSKPAAV